MGSSRKMMFAVAAVMVMMFSAVFSGAGGESDATISTDSMVDYGYVLTYNTNNTQITKVESVDKNGTSQVIYGATNTSNINDLWKFDADTSEDATGLGPFNSFYAAVNLTYGSQDAKKSTNPGMHDRETPFIGHIGYVLNPYDLSQNKYGEEIAVDDYNIMLVVPTVYWYSDTAACKLYISNLKSYPGFPSAVNQNMKAYAHTVTIDGTAVVVPYLAYGVYEGSISNNILYSKTAKTPTTNQMLHTYRSAVAAANPTGTGSVDGKYMLWDFHQWTLMKIMSYTVLGNKDITKVNLYNGANYTKISGSTYRGATGATDELGPYSLTTSGTRSSKVFIENSVGGGRDVVHGLYVQNGYYDKYTYTNNANGSSVNIVTDVNNGEAGSNGSYVKKTSTGSETWDLPYVFEGTLNDSTSHRDKTYRQPMSAFEAGGTANSYLSLNTTFGTNDNDDNRVVRMTYVFPGKLAVYKVGEGSWSSGGTDDKSDEAHYAIGSTIETRPSSELAAPTGKHFSGWQCQYQYMTSTGLVTVDKLVQDGSKVSIPGEPAGNITFTAQWIENPFEISFDPNGGSGDMEVQYLPLNESVALRSNGFVWREHSFIGWADEAVGEKLYDDGEEIMKTATGTMKLYALWEAYKTVTYTNDDGSKSSVFRTFAGDKFFLPDCPWTKSGLAFDFWQEVDGGEYRTGDQYTLGHSDVTFVATYAPGFHLTYDLAGGKGSIAGGLFSAGIMVTVQDIVPTKKNADFDGWMSSLDGSVMVGGDMFPMPAEDVTLTAVWIGGEKPDLVEEDDDDVIDLLRHMNAPEQTHRSNLNWIVVAVAAAMVATASVMLFVFARRRRDDSGTLKVVAPLCISMTLQ